MGFNINIVRPDPDPTAEERNERLAAALLDQFPSLERFPLDYDLVAKTIGVPIQDVLKHWCQFELNDREGKHFGAMIHIWLWGVNIELPSIPATSCAEVLKGLEPLFHLLKAHGLVLEDELDLLGAFESHRRSVEHVGRLLGRSPKPRQTS